MKKSEYITKLGNDAYEFLRDTGGYVKGYGEQFRVMSFSHSPAFNIPKADFKFLIDVGIVELENLIYILSINHKKIYNSCQQKDKKQKQ